MPTDKNTVPYFEEKLQHLYYYIKIIVTSNFIYANKTNLA